MSEEEVEKFLGRFAGGSINWPSSNDFELEDVPAKLQVKNNIIQWLVRKRREKKTHSLYFVRRSSNWR
jgi:hypothetical protein